MWLHLVRHAIDSLFFPRQNTSHIFPITKKMYIGRYDELYLYVDAVYLPNIYMFFYAISPEIITRMTIKPTNHGT